MIDTQAIRKKVLDLALRGKLTEQLPEDGTAEELFQQIQQKIHSKPIKEKAKSEKPFEIPENWKWVHLNEIADTSLGKTLDKSKNTGYLCPYLCSINVHWDGIKLDTVKEARFTEEEKTKYELAPGDLLICEGGDVGRTAIWNQNIVMYYQNALHRVRFYCNINPWFYRDLFEYYKAVGLLDWFSTGMTIKHLVQSSLYSLWLPLPPLSEQKRIVDKVDSMIAILNTIDTLQSQYQDNLATLKSKIIDAGIQGKLTEQLPEDGTAEELYQQIHTNQGIEKKDIADINADLPEIPFTWCWVHLGDIVRVLGGKRIPAGRKLTTEDTGHKYIRISDMKNRSVDAEKLLFVPEDIYPSIAQYIIHKEDVYITVAGTIGRVGKIPESVDGANLTENADRLVFSNLDQDWLIYCLTSTFVQKQIEYLTTQVAQPKLAIKRIQEFLLPLPPFAEQKRIVAKLEELLPLCEG